MGRKKQNTTHWHKKYVLVGHRAGCKLRNIQEEKDPLDSRMDTCRWSIGTGELLRGRSNRESVLCTI